jgi:hypothetical protein
VFVKEIKSEKFRLCVMMLSGNDYEVQILRMCINDIGVGEDPMQKDSCQANNLHNALIHYKVSPYQEDQVEKQPC